MFRRGSGIQCFFCQSPISFPKNPHNFKCPSCGCWNRYDQKGEIISDEPAMHNEQLNSRSFAKRASPSKDRIPTSYGPGPFCHTCQTNQMLLVNLLSNYLPPPDNPEYARRLQLLPEYRDSLHRRYPPVCDSCLPAVEEEIRQKDHMARTKALGGWLQESKGKERQRRVSGTHKDREKATVEMNLWRVRGCLWVLTLLLALFVNSTAAFGYHPFRFPSSLQPVLPFFVLLSLLWTAWDPTYSAFRNSQRQGRDVRVKGKRQYIILQMIAWIVRLNTATLIALKFWKPHLTYLHITDSTSSRNRLYFSISLFIELLTFIGSCMVLRLQHPPAIRLIDTNTHRLGSSRASTPNPSSRSGTPSLSSVVEPDVLAALSLSSKPIITPNPVFGLPSLLSNQPSMSERDSNEDEMDWTPTNTDSNSPFKFTKASNDDALWLRPQRFFAPEKPTGLEGLFERTKLVDDDAMAVDSPRNQFITDRLWKSWWLYALLLVPIAAILYKARKGLLSRSIVDVTQL